MKKLFLKKKTIFVKYIIWEDIIEAQIHPIVTKLFKFKIEPANPSYPKLGENHKGKWGMQLEKNHKEKWGMQLENRNRFQAKKKKSETRVSNIEWKSILEDTG